MKYSHKITYSVLVIIILVVVVFFSYWKFIYKTPEQIAINAVKGMFQDIKEGKTIETRVSSDYYAMLSKNDRAYLIDNDSFSEYKSAEDTAGEIVIQRKGISDGKEFNQWFSLEKINNEYKIVNSFRYVAFHGNLSYNIPHIDVTSFWDMKIAKLIDTIDKGMKLELVDTKYLDHDFLTGKVRVTNNTEYDIENLHLIVYNYDKDGISISPDDVYISMIPKKGKSEASWYNSHCGECVTHKIEIKSINP